MTSSHVYLTVFGLAICALIADAVPLKRTISPHDDQNVSFEDKTYRKYTEELLSNYKYKNYFSAIFQNEKVKDDFAKFVNDGLTQQVKNDLAGLRIYKKVGDAEVPVVMFGPQMDSWLGILPQWKRTKRYFFGKIEEYLSTHPEVVYRMDHTPVEP